MAELVVVPDQRIPSENNPPNNWLSHDGTVKWTPDNRTHVSTITESNGRALSSTTDVGIQGSIYASSKGFSARLASSDTSDFRTLHFFGDTGGLSFGNLNPGQTVSGGNESCWLRDVTGFFCEINGSSTINNDYGGSGDSANDGCGLVRHIRVYGVYIDSQRKTHIFEMTSGEKLQGIFHNYTDNVPGRWVKFGYRLTDTDAEKVINKKLMLGGWCVHALHKKTCGGGNKSKNMTFRLRYMTPVVTSDRFNYSVGGNYPWQIAMPPNTAAQKAVGGLAGSSPPPMYTK